MMRDSNGVLVGDMVRVTRPGINLGRIGRVEGYRNGFHAGPVPMGSVTKRTVYVVEFEPGDGAGYYASEFEVIPTEDDAA